jgi:enediyne biosynthesis protein E4
MDFLQNRRQIDRIPAMHHGAGRKRALRHSRFVQALLKFRCSVAVCLVCANSTLCGADWQAGAGFRHRELAVPASGRSYLEKTAARETGIDFTNALSEAKGLENSVLTEGAGVAAGDVDGDGWCDLFFSGIERPSVLYRNLGNWKFEDITAAAGVACAGQPSTGAALADIDGDGDLDLLVNALGGGTRLFLNDSKGRFLEPTNCGLARKFGSTSMALADVDGNGTLDLYVANYATTKIEDRPHAKFESKVIEGKIVLTAIDGVPLSSPELTNRYFVDATKTVRELGELDIFYLNDGRGNFQRKSWTDGTFTDDQGKPLATLPYDFGLSVMFRDMDGDLDPDIYVCNDLFPPDRIWVNDGHGRFRAMSNLAMRNISLFSMGVDFADINHDGFDDLFVVDMLSRGHLSRKVQTVGVPRQFLPVGKIDNRPQYKKNTLFLNRGDGTYAEIAQLCGLEATEWSWMPAFLDVDMDGFEDVLVTTGHMRDSLNADVVGQILRLRSGRQLSAAEHRALKKELFPMLKTSLQAFRNRGDLTFEDKARDWGFDYQGITQAMCLADLDDDGDADVIVVPLNDTVCVYRNQTAAPRVAVRLKGNAPNTRGIGAKIKLLGGVVPVQQQEMISGGRYLSCDDAARTFVAGAATNNMSLEVTWRNGARSVVTNVRANHLYEVAESSSVHGSKPGGESRGTTPLFKDASHLLKHLHVDDGFDDFGRQPLLPKRLSQLGPGVSWFDVDGDGWDDVIIGGGVTGRLAVYRNDGKGGFERVTQAAIDEPLMRDQTTIVGWQKADGQRVLLAGSSNYEDGAAQGSCAREFDLAKQTVADHLPPWECSTGPMTMGDWNGDGVLDLFVGGRVLPAKYPDDPFSILFRGTGNSFELDKANTKALLHAGLVSGAVFSDLDNDGLPELLLACEWGPVRVFRFERGVCRETTRELGLDKYLGWWNGLATGDFDGDGRMDIVASNWGRNSKYQSHRTQPLRIYYGDWKANGTIDSVDAYFDPGSNKYVPWCSFVVAKSLPWVGPQFTTQDSFGKAGVAELLGERHSNARVLEGNWLDTTLFMNRGTSFVPQPLPIEAQFAPAFGISVADLNGDGNEDIFLGQNFFAVDGDTPRYDAGRGLLLEGDGHGQFQAVSAKTSGVEVYGEQRGCAVSDYDGDGRVDLVTTQNGAETKLYRNESARPGLRVRLSGPPGNPTGAGATLRVMMGDKMGPAKQIHAGSGYWSQDSVVQVVPLAGQISIRWPGGKTTVAKVPPGAREISINTAGEVKVSR